jgi:hypothetical protein
VRVKLTELTFVLAKPWRGTSRGNFHIVNWNLPTMALRKVDVVSVRRPELVVDADGTKQLVDVVDEQVPAFAAGDARRGPAAEAACRRCRSILRHLSVRAFPIAVQHAVALAENERIDAERAKAARQAARIAAAVRAAEAERAAAIAARVASERATAEQIAAAGATPAPAGAGFAGRGRQRDRLGELERGDQGGPVAGAMGHPAGRLRGRRGRGAPVRLRDDAHGPRHPRVRGGPRPSTTRARCWAPPRPSRCASDYRR